MLHKRSRNYILFNGTQLDLKYETNKNVIELKMMSWLSLLETEYLFAADAVLGKFVIVAWITVNVTSFGEETLRAYRRFTAATSEALVVPRVSFVHDRLCACSRQETD